MKDIYLILFLIIPFLLQGQVTSILTTSHGDGKDAMVWNTGNFSPPSNVLNRGSDERLLVHAWTNSGIPDTSRVLVYFDFSLLPQGFTLIDAKFSISNLPNTPSFQGEHKGDNPSHLRRITESWGEYTVLWGNKPNFTYQNEVAVPASVDPHQNFTNIDVTQLVQDMLDDPNNSFGFIMSLDTEFPYRALTFASKEAQGGYLGPKLILTYMPPNNTNNLVKGNVEVKVFPNPAYESSQLVISNSDSEVKTVNLFDIYGRWISSPIKKEEDQFEIERNNLPPGNYIIMVEYEDGLISRSILNFL